jgi:hypothetical protein
LHFSYADLKPSQTFTKQSSCFLPHVIYYADEEIQTEIVFTKQ